MILAISDWIFPIVLGLSLGFLIAYARNKKPNGGILYLEPDEFRKNMRRGQLIDIRSDEDYQKEKINGSRNYPKKSIFQNLYLIRADQPIFLYGDSDKGLVKKVGTKLMKKGYHPVYVLKGGLDEWPYPKK
ncbi:MAG: rhodanese-like domain-containing protein [Candidatus Izemoplasmatales bacterium]